MRVASACPVDWRTAALWVIVSGAAMIARASIYLALRADVSFAYGLIVFGAFAVSVGVWLRYFWKGMPRGLPHHP